MDRFGGFQPALKMASKCPPRPLAAPHLCAWAHVQRGRDGQQLPLSRDAAGARGAGISLVGTYEQKTFRTRLAEDSPVLLRCAVGVPELSAALGLCVVVGRFVIVLNVACIVRGSELIGSARRAIFARADRYRETSPFLSAFFCCAVCG